MRNLGQENVILRRVCGGYNSLQEPISANGEKCVCGGFSSAADAGLILKNNIKKIGDTHLFFNNLSLFSSLSSQRLNYMFTHRGIPFFAAGFFCHQNRLWSAKKPAALFLKFCGGFWKEKGA